MTKEETKDELYRLLSDCVNGGYPIRNNTQKGRYRKAVKEAIQALEQSDKNLLKIEARLQAIREIANIACLDDKDYENISEFCDEIYNLVKAESEE